MLERKIAIGLITSTEYLDAIHKEWNNEYIGSATIKLIAQWCWEHYKKFGKAPKRDIELIYEKKSKKIDPDLAEELETDFLPELSSEFEQEEFDVEYLVHETREYFNERKLAILSENIDALIEKGNIKEAAELVKQFELLSDEENDESNILDLADEDVVMQKVEDALNTSLQNVLQYPGALGEFLNDELVRGGFVAFLAPEKRGKCLTGDHLITLSSGKEVTIEKLFKLKHRNIIAYNEEKQKFEKAVITDFWVNGKKPVYKIITKTGRKITITKNHPLLTPDGWQDLTKLKQGSFIAVPKELIYYGKNKLSDSQIKLLAYFIAEGCLMSYKTKYVTTNHFSFTNSEKEIQQDFTKAVNELNCSVTWKGITGEVVNGVNNRGKQNKNYVKKLLKAAHLLNKKSYDKRIPDIVFQLNKKGLALFLNILYTCDGWINKDGKEIGFTVANEELARQVQSLLTRFGIVSVLSFKQNDKYGAFCVSIRSAEYVRLFIHKIGFSFSKQEKAKKALQYVKTRNVAKSFVDRLPHQIASNFLNELNKKYGKEQVRKMFPHSDSVREQIKKKKPLMRQSFADVKNTEVGKKYLQSSILWDEIMQIEYVGIEETYDITVETHHNFIANNVIVHNTWLLLDMLMRSLQQNRRVAFVQAGDMTEAQQLVRIAIYLAKRSNKERFCGEIYMPVVDCVKNQTDDCREKVRECDFGIFRERTFEQLKKQVPTKQELVEAYEAYPDYRRCINCSAFKKHRWGTVWLQKIPPRPVLTAKHAKKLIKRFFVDAEKNVRLLTYPNDTLTVSKMESDLDAAGFEPEIILLDYPDLMVAETTSKEVRHQQNSIWKKLRGVSQKRNCLLVAPTQADAAAYDQNTLKLKNFSEDKRKYAHVTAFFSMNQDKEGIEKEIGLLRIGKLIARESDFHISQQVTVLQCIPIGRPVLDSYL